MKRTALFLIAATCIGAAPATPPQPQIPSQRIDAAIAALDGVAADVQHRSGVPGMAIAVVRNDRVVYAKGFGVRTIGQSTRVDPNTVFLLASVSKAVAATVVAAAVSNGTVKWSDPVAKYIHGFTLRDPWVGAHVTIADMFAHRSGLPDHAGDLLEDLGYSREAILQKLALEPLAPFRISYAYTNFGLTAGAQAVANATGTSWEALSKQLLYEPLGMTHTSSRWIDYANAPDHATLHVRHGNEWKTSSRDADAQSPAGGASSTVLDLAKWMSLQMDQGTYEGKRIASPEALSPMQRPQIVSNPPAQPFGRPSFYGYGVIVSYDDQGRLHLSHSGAFALGAATAFEMLPSEKLGIVVLTNGAPTGVPETIAKTFFDDVEFGHPTRDWYAFLKPYFAKMSENRSELAGKQPPANPAPAQPLATYAGTYANDYYGPATVSVENGALWISLGPKPVRYQLKHWSGNVFAFEPFGENGVGVNAITFSPKSTKHPATLVVEYLNENGLGSFTR